MDKGVELVTKFKVRIPLRLWVLERAFNLETLKIYFRKPFRGADPTVIKE